MTTEEIDTLLAQKGLTSPLHTEFARQIRAQLLFRQAQEALAQLELDAHTIGDDENMREARLLLLRLTRPCPA